MAEPVLIIACGALAREIQHLKRVNGWDHVQLQCISAELHNRPDEIPNQLRLRIGEARQRYQHIFVAYADCGTGGAIDRIIQAHPDVKRLPGAHCYAFFAGLDRFDQIAEQEPGTFYLTDFLVRHFNALVIEGLGIDKHPALLEAYFGNYRRVVYMSQLPDPQLMQQAREAAAFLNLEFEHIATGFGALETHLADYVGSTG